MAEEEHAAASAEGNGGDGQKNKNKKYRRDKPWDNETIDHWKIEPYTEDVAQGNCLIEETSFSTLFPKYRENYLREWWSHITRVLQKFHIDCSLDLIEGSMTVKTTRKTWDPYAIIKARDFVKLLARSVPFQQAERIFEDEMACDIIKIGTTVRNKERFVKRRQRLLGPNNATLRAIELLTKCFMLVQGNTVSCMGPYKGLKQARKIVMDCMNNIHPVYNIKTLMIKKELAENPAMANENWERFLPQFKKKNVKQKKLKVSKKKKDVFPPAQTPSKIDLQIESGEYFLKESERLEKRKSERDAKQAAAVQKKQEERQKDFVPPTEKAHKRKADAPAPAVDVDALTKKIKSAKAPSKAGDKASAASDFVVSASKKKKEKKDRD